MRFRLGLAAAALLAVAAIPRFREAPHRARACSKASIPTAIPRKPETPAAEPARKAVSLPDRFATEPSPEERLEIVREMANCPEFLEEVRRTDPHPDVRRFAGELLQLARR